VSNVEVAGCGGRAGVSEVSQYVCLTPYALCLTRIVLLPYACEASRLPVAAAAQVSVFVLFFYSQALQY
jgi:hypothetical protein